MTQPITKIWSSAIGTVESVAPDEISVLLDIDSPRSTSLNTGIPTPFPRINSFVLLPNESGAVVGIVIWLGIEKSQYPKRRGFKDFGLIDLPFPLRKMVISPIGTLYLKAQQWILEHGVKSFPSVGDQVMLPSREQTIAVVSGQGEDSRVQIGTCPIAHNTPVSVDPDKMFGRHVAVLGNTGSGKSCTLAALVRSAVESAQGVLRTSKISGVDEKDRNFEENPNTRFIVLDPNGEYSKCFQDLGEGCRVFQVPPKTNDDATDFVLPSWMWNSSEWAAVAQAAPRAQRPLLQEALRNLRSGKHSELSSENRLLSRCKSLQAYLQQYAGRGACGFPANTNCGQQLSRFLEDITLYSQTLTDDVKSRVESLSSLVLNTLNSRKWTSKEGREGFNDFGDRDLIHISESVDEVLDLLQPNIPVLINEDSPLPFNPELLAENLESIAMQEGGSATQFISTLTMRIRGLLSDTRMNGVINPTLSITLDEWLDRYIGSNDASNGPVAVIDLSLVPYEILHLVIAVFSRLILESLQRYLKLNKQSLPTVLILEEAHTFVAKKTSQVEEIPTPTDMCRGIFERIAREGRKFGLGLVLSSQRPSELSETVLSQCNSFLLHRITNDRDQQLISRLVPESARGLLSELPSLPTRNCVLLGITSRVPVLVEVKSLDENQKPISDDPDFGRFGRKNNRE